ncbi:GroES-like protein [Ceratobasidium sp. AG-I]|nr:GroES-like protein [Ceratobasidium sp. AG-I]
MTRTQKASILPSLGADLIVQDRPIPTPDAHQVVIKVTAAAANPLDHTHLFVPIYIKEYPAILGMDGAGIVETVGSNVKAFKKGDRVFFQCNFTLDDSTFQQYILADPNLLGRVPANITDDQASTVPSSLSTAVVSLFLGTGVRPALEGPTVTNSPIVILGGSGSVGRLTIQLARIAGFSPIITTSSKAHAESVKALGATHVFERTVSAEVIQEVIKISGHPLKLVVDAVSTPETQLFAFKLLVTQPDVPSDGFCLQLLLPIAKELEALNRARPEGRIAVNMVQGIVHMFPEAISPFYAVAEKWLEEGKLVPAHVQLVEGGLASIPKALDILGKGVSGVKVVIRPQD